MENEEIKGDLAVGRDMTVGGDLNVRGTATIDHDLIVKGLVRCENMPGGEGLVTNEGVSAEWVLSQLAGYATESWVREQLKGYSPGSSGETPNLTGYATESWVREQLNGYALTSHNHDGVYLSITGTAEAAKKLATGRKLWGNVFDGTKDVSGTIVFTQGLTIGERIEEDGTRTLKVNGNIMAEGYISCKDVNGGSTGGGTGTGTFDPDILDGYATEQWVTDHFSFKDHSHGETGDLTGYATESWVREQLNGYALAGHNHDGVYLSITGTAEAAKKLATARTLWGQNFNGTGNVTGALSNVGNIMPDGTSNDIYQIGSSSAQFKQIFAGILRNDAGHYLQICQAANNNMSFLTNNAVRMLVFGTQSSELKGQVAVLTNLLVGMEWPRTWASDKEVPKLEIEGSAYLSSRLYMSQTDQSAYIEYDSANGMFKFSKGIYSVGSISALNSSLGLTELKLTNNLTVGNLRISHESGNMKAYVEPLEPNMQLYFYRSTIMKFSSVVFGTTISATTGTFSGMVQTGAAGLKLGGSTGFTLTSDTTGIQPRIKVTLTDNSVRYINFTTT